MNRARYAAVLVSALVLVAMTGCDGSSDPTSLIAPPDGLRAADLRLLDYEDVLNAPGAPTLESAAALPDDLGAHRGHGPDAGPALRGMELDPEQQESILALFDSYRECLQAPLEEFRDSVREILERAEQARQQILGDLRNGEIDGPEARDRLRALGRATLRAVRDNPAGPSIREAICACRDELLDGIRGVLDEEQQSVWDAWVSGREGSCVGP